MKRLLIFVLTSLVLGTVLSCSKKGENNDCANVAGNNVHISLQELAKHQHIPGPVQDIIQKLVTDSMRWWSTYSFVTPQYLSDPQMRLRLDSVNEALAWTEKEYNNPLVKGRLWNQKGLCDIELQEHDSAIACFTLASQDFAAAKAFRELSTATVNLAATHYRAGNITDALRHYKRALLLSDSLNCPINLVSIQVALAQLYADLRNYQLAHNHLNKAKEHLARANAFEHYMYYFTRAICYYYQKKYSLSYATFNIAMEYAQEIGQFQQIRCQSCMSEISLINNNLDLALTHIEPCIQILRQYPDMKHKSVKFNLCSIAADVLFACGRKQEAEEMLRMLPPDNEVKMLRYLSWHYEHMSQQAEQQKDFEEAFRNLKTAQTYQAQINSEHAINNVIEINERYQNDTTKLRQNYDIAQLKAKMTQHQLKLTIIIVGLLLVVSLCIASIVLIRRKNEKDYQRQFNQISKLRMDVVRNRVSPHYVFNVLAMMLPKFKSDPELHQLSELFIGVIRGNLLASNQLSIAYSEEIQLVKQYVDLYHRARNPYPTVTWHDATNGEADQVMVPTMCVQIPIENALKHAFETLDEHSAIHVFTMTEDRRLMIRIIDNGTGYNPGKVAATGRDTGTGLRVLSRTISLLNSQNTRPIDFHIKNLCQNNQQGTEVQISIPFEYQYQ